MEFKEELVLGGSMGSSAQRRPTRSSSHHRFTLRRLSTASTASSSTTSVDSLTADKPSCCASRQTSTDDCDVLRFIAWAAVKRNTSESITSDQKRQCPLWKCQETFPSFELMLQHLYQCSWLSQGEYWCYSCGKVERFNNSKGRRCLSHPSKKRKIVNIAKSFFSSLGHKPRGGSIADSEIDLDESRLSFESLDPLPQHTEILSTEIHEMECSSARLSTIQEVLDEAEPMFEQMTRRLPQQVPADAAPSAVQQFATLPPQTMGHYPAEAAELDSMPQVDVACRFDFSGVVSPQDLMRTPISATSRPALQLRTNDLGQHQVPVKSRSKVLAPSNSVRSTCSTNSTASHVSSISAWSGEWSHAPGFESNLTTPGDDDNISLLDFLADTTCGAVADYVSEFDADCNQDAFMGALPANLPMVMPDSTFDAFQGVLPGNPEDLPLASALEFEQHAVELPTLSNEIELPADEPLSTFRRKDDYPEAKHLVDSVRAALEMHIAESQSKLKHLPGNQLARQFILMLPKAVAKEGLTTLKQVLDGRLPMSQLKLLCFIHIVYAFSLVMHEQEMQSRCNELFVQALSYGPLALRSDLKAWTQVVTSLWKPNRMTTSAVKELAEAKLKHSTPASGDENNKLSAVSPNSPETDSLLFVAKYFLDELEYRTLSASAKARPSPGDHQELEITDLDPEKSDNLPLLYTAHVMKLAERYHYVPGYLESLARLSHLIDTRQIRTPRQLEVHLIHAGKVHLSMDTYCGSYINEIRSITDALYDWCNLQPGTRRLYYQSAVGFIESMIQEAKAPMGIEAKDITAVDTTLDGLNDFFDTLALQLNQSDLIPAGLPGFSDEMMCAPATAHSARTASDSPRDTQWELTRDDSSTEGPSSMPSTTPGSQCSASTLPSVESDRCCDICGYRPKGDPKWFAGSMAKHKRLMHATSPPKIYKCEYPGCKSQYKNRPDNLRQHQIEKGHFVNSGDGSSSRPTKRKKMDENR